MSALLIAHPKAGSAQGASADELVAALELAGEVTISDGGGEDAIIAAAEDFDSVIVAGGDGSLHLVLNALAGRIDEITLGLIPMGTGNDLARTLGLPEDPLAAAAALAAGATRSIDLGRVRSGTDERLFLNACMGGFSVRADEAVDESDKERLGALAFWWGGIKAATDIERTDVIVNGVEVSDCVAVGVGNGQTCGGGIEVWPEARPDDGRLDVAVLPAPTNAAALRLAAKVKRGSHLAIDEVVYQQAPTIRIEGSDPVPFNVDGEVLGFETPLTFEIAGSVRMMVPEGAP